MSVLCPATFCIPHFYLTPFTDEKASLERSSNLPRVTQQAVSESWDSVSWIRAAFPEGGLHVRAGLCIVPIITAALQVVFPFTKQGNSLR